MIGEAAETGDELICPVSARVVRSTVVGKCQPSELPPSVKESQQQAEKLEKKEPIFSC